MNHRPYLSLFFGLTVMAALGAVPTARAQGDIIIVPPPLPRHPQPPMPHPRPPSPGQVRLTLQALNVQAEITDGVAVTTVRQSFQSPFDQPVEGTYVFPLPDEVAVGDFAMTVDGKTLHGEVLDANAARQTYEEIVRRARDPGLLEYLGSRLFKARIFPIPPHGKVEVELRYSQTLTEQGGLGQFRQPLHRESAGAPPLDQLVLNVKLASTLPLASVFSPTHECRITRPSAREATISYEAGRVTPDRDFLLYYQRQDAAFGVAVLAHRGAGEPGTFLLRISPRVEPADEEVLPKDIAFVIDTSGSMAGPKLEQVKRALTFCVNALNPRDRFNILAFSSEVHPFRDGLVAADADARQAAAKYASELKALGGTNIHAALLNALENDPRDGARPYLIVFMTDGQPTVDITNPEQILKDVAERNGRSVRFHVLGVGTEVNTQLLDKLAETTRGTRDYCTEKEDLELKLGAMVTRLASPVLTNLTLHVTGVSVSDVYPQTLPDLFRGNDLVVFGRYDGSGVASIRLEGQAGGTARTVGYEATFPALEPGGDFLPRLWANRKVAYLLDQIRLHGSNQELVDEVVRLAKRYGIVTPYTSALILEDGSKSPGSWTQSDTMQPMLRRLGEADKQAGVRAGIPASVSGGAAVGRSVELKEAEYATAPSAEHDAYARDEAGQLLVRHVGDRAFVWTDGRWTDTTWNQKLQPTKVAAFSDEYFALLAKHPELKPFFALGPRVLVVLGDQAFETVAEAGEAPVREGEAPAEP